MDCLVIGGGVIGCTAALRIRQRGLGVTLIERGPLAGEATWAAAGILAPQAEAHGPGALFELQCRSRDLWPAFADELRETGIDVGLQRTGTLMLGDQRSRFEWQKRAGLRVEARGESLFLPDDHSLDPRLLGGALSAALAHARVQVVTGSARRVLHDGQRVTGLVVDEQALEAHTVVLAAGAWSSQLEGLPRLPRVRPLRGQMVELQARPGLLPQVIFGDGGYLVPRADGRVLCGSSEDDVGFVKQVTPPVLARLLSRAVTIEPRLAGAQVTASWAGFRPATEDRLPVLGATELAGLYAATGHHRNGILLAPITGEIVAALVTQSTPPVNLAEFSPAR